MKTLALLGLVTLCLLPAPKSSATVGTVNTACAVMTFGAYPSPDALTTHFEWDIPSLLVSVTEELYLRAQYYDLQHGWTTTGSWLIHTETYQAAGSGMSSPSYWVDWTPYKRQNFGEVISYCTQIKVIDLNGHPYTAKSSWTRNSPWR